MTECTACAKAMANPLCGEYAAGCLDCTARRIARTPAALMAVMGDPEELRAVIAEAFPDYHAGRKLVWAWLERWKKRNAA